MIEIFKAKSFHTFIRLTEPITLCLSLAPHAITRM